MQGNDANIPPAGNREGHFVAVKTQELQDGQKFGDGTSSIMSFKEVALTVGELDFQVSHVLHVTQLVLTLLTVMHKDNVRKTGWKTPGYWKAPCLYAWQYKDQKPVWDPMTYICYTGSSVPILIHLRLDKDWMFHTFQSEFGSWY